MSKTQSQPSSFQLAQALSALLAKYKASCLLVDRQYQLLSSFNEGLEVLKEPVGRRTTDITQRIVAELEFPLISALHWAQSERGPVSARGLKMEREGRRYNLQLEVTYHESNNGREDFFSIVFQEEQTPPRSSEEKWEAETMGDQQIRAREEELQPTYKQLQLQEVIAELETSNQEQQVKNKELEERVEECTQARQKAEARLRAILTTTSALVGLKDREGRYLVVNREYLASLGLREEQVIGQRARALFPPKIAEVLRANDQQVLESKSVLQFEEQIPQADGSLRTYLTTKAPLMNQKGEVEAICSISTDISEQKRTEAELREGVARERTLLKIVEKMRQSLELEEILATTTEQLRATLKCDRVTLYRFNPDWSGEFVAEAGGGEWIKLVDNQQLSMGLDTYLQETQGGRYKQNETWAVEDIESADLSDCHRELYSQIQAKSVAIAPIKQGEKLWGLLAAYQNQGPRGWKEGEMRLLTQTGIQLGISIGQMDLFSQIQQQSLQLQQAKEAAERANQTKDVFLAHMSHELRTPLNSILGFSSILERELSCEPEQLHSVELVKQSGKHLLALINELLDFSKVSAQKLELEPSALNLIQFLEEVAEIFQFKAQQKGLNFSAQIFPSVPRAVSVDQVRLRQVLFNLLSNAIKFTETGRVIFTVGARADFPVEIEEIDRGTPVSAGSAVKRRSNADCPEAAFVNNNRQITHLSSRRLRFQIEDTGRGIPDGKLEQIFAPFEQLINNTARLEGTGLGLTISQKIIQLMGGEIQVESEVARGSKFWFELELREIEAELLPPVTKAVTATKRKLNTPCKILIVDDHEENRLLLVKYLQSVGFTLKSARNGQEGLALAEIFQPEAIVTDLAMPVMNGQELMARIQQHPHLRETLVIAISAHREFILGSSELDCDDFLSKPVDLSQLLEVLDTHLQLDWQWKESTPEAPPPSALIAPEQQDVISLLEAVKLGDIEAIEAQIKAIEAKNSRYLTFVAEVRQLARSFQLLRLEQLLQKLGSALKE